MNRWIRFASFLAIAALFVFVAMPGCNKMEPAPGKDKGPPAHKHGKTPHGGPFAEWEELDYHAEFTVDHAKKQVTVYILDKEMEKSPKIDPAKITKVKLAVLGSTPPVLIDLKLDDKASADKGFPFVGTHDFFATPKDFKGDISGNVDGKPYNGEFNFKASTKAQLFLQPGGIYTAADVKANGNTTPTERFKGKEWDHADNLKPGDKTCPVTKNKAEAECAWIVQGQRYEFCCPPCLDKFIGWAHHQPEKVKNANDYVFNGK